MSKKRARHSAAFKAKLPLAALLEELTVAEPVLRHGVYPIMIHFMEENIS